MEFNFGTIDPIVFLFCTFIIIFYHIIISNCATILKAGGSIPDEVIGIFIVLTFWRRIFFFQILAHLYLKCE